MWEKLTEIIFCSLVDNGANFNSTNLFGATDCINGSLIPREYFGVKTTNFTVLINVHQKFGPLHRLVYANKPSFISNIPDFRTKFFLLLLGSWWKQWKTAIWGWHYGNYCLKVKKLKMFYSWTFKIFNKSRLMINHEGCVNTLSGECSEFYELHGKDGRNSTSPSRYTNIHL